MFVGYSETQKAFRFWNSKTRKIKISRDVDFIEDQITIPAFNLDTSAINTLIPPSTPSLINRIHWLLKTTRHLLMNAPHQHARRNKIYKKNQNDVTLRDLAAHLGSGGLQTPLVRVLPWPPESCDEPISFDEAMKSDEAVQWKAAMEEEYDCLLKNKTWTLVAPPPGRQVIKNKWVFKQKYAKDGSVQRYKARLVAKGFSQTPGIDFDETYAPVVKYESLRAILSIAAAKDMEIIQLELS